MIYPRLGVDYGGAGIFYFPPYGKQWGAEVRRTQGRRATVLVDPLSPGATLSSSVASAARFELSGQIMMPTAGEARVVTAEMLQALGGGADGTFKFFRFHDQYWRHCFVEKPEDIELDLTREPFGVVGFRVRFTAGDPVVYSDDEVGPGPYEDDIYPASGEPGGTTMSAVKQKTNYAVVFPGEVQITPVGQSFEIVPEGEAGDVLEVVSLQATCNQLLGSGGSTQIRVSKQPAGGPITDSILLVLNHDQRSGRNGGSFTIDSGDTLYVFCEAAAGHQDLMVGVVVEG